MNLFSLLIKGGDIRMYIHSLFTDPWRTSKKEREITINGIHMVVRRRSSDIFVVREVFMRQVYGTPPHGIVVDLGANIGAFSLFAARTATQVYAFEPESSNFAQLEKNVTLNGTLPIHIFKKAVGGMNGLRSLFPTAINKGASSIVHERGGSVSEQVDMVTLDHVLALCGLTHIDFLKVDIEGSEYELVENASTHTLRRIGAIVMEIHHVRGRRFSDITTKLESAGFTVRSSHTHYWFGMRMLYATRK